MKLTPIDIQQQHFARSFRGYDSREVDSFLELVGEQMGALSREVNELKSELRRSQQEVFEHREREATLREAMLTAQQAIDEIRDQAQKEAQLIVSEAELTSEKILHNAHTRVSQILEEISELRRQRTRAIRRRRKPIRRPQHRVATRAQHGWSETATLYLICPSVFVQYRNRHTTESSHR